MAREALDLMHQERWSEAQSLLARAYQLVPAPTVAVLEGRALEQMGKLVEAGERYETARTGAANGPSGAFRDASDDAERRLAHVRQRIPKLSIRLEGEGVDPNRVVVTLDGQSVPRDKWSAPVPVNPGEHVVSAAVGGHVAVEDQVLLREAESKQVLLRLHGDAPPPAPASPAPAPDVVQVTPESPPARTWGWIAIGVGAAGVTTGVVAGVVMLDAKSSLDTQCSPVCPGAAESDLSRFRTARIVSAVGYGAGVVGLGVGAAILLLSPTPPPRERRASLQVWGGPAQVGLEGFF